MAGVVTHGALNQGRVVVGLRNTLDETVGIIGGAERSLSGEMFLLDEKAMSAALKGKPGLDSAFVADPERLGMGQIDTKVLKGIGAVVHPHGAMPNKVHAKMLVADSNTGIISTGAWYTDGGKRDNWLDLAVVVDGEVAKRAEALTRTTVAGDVDAFRAAAEQAAEVGVYINDPQQGVMMLGPQMRNMIENAQERLIVAVKRDDSPEVKQLLDAARARGVDVTQLTRLQSGKALHGNVIIADDHAYIGSAMLNRRGLEGSGTSNRASRELGVVVNGELTEQVRAALMQLPDNRVPAAGGDGAAVAAADGSSNLFRPRNIAIGAGVAGVGVGGAVVWRSRQ